MCRLRERVVHVSPPGVETAKALLMVVLKYIYVMDPTTGERLLGWKLLNTIMRQIRLVLGGAVSGAYCIPCICLDSLHINVYTCWTYHCVPLLSPLIFCLLVWSPQSLSNLVPHRCWLLLCWHATSVCVADPPVEGLVYRIIDTGKPGTERYKVKYCRGTNSNETVNRPLKDTMPDRCTAPYFTTAFFFYITPYNLRLGQEHLGEPQIGCYDLLMLQKVIYV